MSTTAYDTAASTPTSPWRQERWGWWAPLARIRCLLAQQICHGLD